MKLTDNKQKQNSLDLAEDSRETEWKYPSFIAELFQGNFEWNLIHPYPVQKADDKLIGDKFLAELEKCLRENINPEEVDRTGEVSQKARAELAKIGCFAMKIPKKYGGLELSVINYNRAIALIGSYCGSTAVLLSAHQSIGVPQPLIAFGTEEQKEKYLPMFAKGVISAFALTEPDVGSDPANMKTTAVPTEDGSHYIINGEKMWITNGPIADIIIVMAQTPPKIVNGKEKKQITAFIVETNAEGFEIPNLCNFMGIRGISNGILKFNNVKVPKENIIGELGKGLKLALTVLNTGRLTIPAAVSGSSKLSLKYCRDWVKKRIQWGLPIGKHQAVANKLAFMASNTLAMESVVWIASAYADNKKNDFRLEAAMAKYFCTEVAWQLLDEALQIRGGRGFETAESLKNRGEDAYPIERMLRDCRVNRIIEGTTEIMQLFIAREAMDTHVRYIMPVMDSKNSLGKRFNALVKAFKFYSWWYPKQWISLSKCYKAKNLSSNNKKHLGYLANTSKRLARDLFHTMGIYQQSLEKEQILVSNFVDIGTYLFAMAATLSYADQMAGQDNVDSSSVQELADLFCKKAKQKIEKCFKEVIWNDNKLINKVSDNFFDDKYEWLENGIIK